MKISSTEKELLDLPGKTEDEQIVFLSSRNILNAYQCHKCDLEQCESLADLAERLWGKLPNDLSGLADVYKQVNHLRKDQALEGAYWKWWAIESIPIHRIVAALIALKRSGGEL
jgi:hypothetical protein